MYTQYDYYAIVIGAGPAGVTIAKGLKEAGKSVLLIEKGSITSDSANISCIASKSLISSANIAHDLWLSGLYGIDMHSSDFHSTRVLARVRSICEALQQKSSLESLQKSGVEVLTSLCSFVDPHTVVDEKGQKYSARSIIIATGSTAKIPSIKGLDLVPYYTNESIFQATEIPASLGIIGAGQIGTELAQAFRRLGSSVVLIEQKESLLRGEEPAAYKAIQSALVKEGVELYVGSKVMRVRKENDKTAIHIKRLTDEKEYELHVDRLLVAAGRTPTIEGLRLELAGVTCSDAGISIDEYGRTSQPHIWAAGDVVGELYYTHVAYNQANVVLNNILKPWPFQKKMPNAAAIARVAFTDPEVASVGITEEEAIERYGNSKIAVYYLPVAEADRALCESETDGFIKIVTKRFSSKILGATICCPGAATMLAEIQFAMQHNVPLRKLSGIIHPYPTYSQLIEKAAHKWLSDTIIPFIRKLFKARP